MMKLRDVVHIGGFLVALNGFSAGTAFLTSSPTRPSCTVYVQPVSGGAASTAACGAEIRVSEPAIAWIEAGDHISTWSARLRASGETRLDMPLVRGRRLKLTSPHPPQRRLRLIVDSDAADFFDRWLSDIDPPAGILAPQGTSLVLEYNRDQISAVSRRISPRGDAMIEVTSSNDGGDMIAFVDGNLGSESVLRATTEQMDVPAQTHLTSHERLIAVWYGLAPGAVDLELADTKHFVRATAEVRRNEVANIATEARRKPHLDIDFDGTELKNERIKITLSDPSTRQPIDSREYVKPGPATFDDLNPAKYNLLIDIDGHQFIESSDLTAGEPRQHVIELSPIDLHGTFYLGGTPHPATLEFQVGEQAASVRTNERGEYEFRTWRPRRIAVNIVPDGREGAAFRELLNVRESQKRDFELPDNRYRVRVTEEGTNKPVSGATVHYMNRWTNAESQRSQSSGHQLESDANGDALLPPLKVGTLTIGARHEHYVMSDPVELWVTDTGSEMITIELSRVKQGDTLTLLTPAGAPAAGARVAATSEPLGGTLTTVQVADSKGTLTIPPALDGHVLLVSHEGSAAYARRWTSNAGDQQWQLSIPGAPLAVHAVGADRKPVPVGSLVVWIGEFPVAGAPLAFLTRRGAAVNAQGFWVADNLPPTPLRLIVTGNSIPELHANRQHESLSTTIAYPWPREIILESRTW